MKFLKSLRLWFLHVICELYLVVTCLWHYRRRWKLHANGWFVWVSIDEPLTEEEQAWFEARIEKVYPRMLERESLPRHN